MAINRPDMGYNIPFHCMLFCSFRLLLGESNSAIIYMNSCYLDSREENQKKVMCKSVLTLNVRRRRAISVRVLHGYTVGTFFLNRTRTHKRHGTTCIHYKSHKQFYKYSITSAKHFKRHVSHSICSCSDMYSCFRVPPDDEVLVNNCLDKGDGKAGERCKKCSRACAT